MVAKRDSAVCPLFLAAVAQDALDIGAAHAAGVAPRRRAVAVQADDVTTAPADPVDVEERSVTRVAHLSYTLNRALPCNLGCNDIVATRCILTLHSTTLYSIVTFIITHNHHYIIPNFVTSIKVTILREQLRFEISSLV